MQSTFQPSTKTQRNKIRRGAVSLLALLILLILLFSAAKYFGTRYATQVIDKQIHESGLAPLIHYKSISFNPLTLTPVMHSVSIGNKRYPWLRLTHIKFNYLPVIYPKLNVDFQFDDNKTSFIARDTRRLMTLMGIQQLTGQGHFLSAPKEGNIDSTLTLQVDQVGHLFFNSNIDILNQDVSLQEFRSDLLASMALGQLDAIPILYGDSIAFHKIALRFRDEGLIKRQWPEFSAKSSHEALPYFKTLSAYLGLAPYHSIQNHHISTQVTTFLTKANTLSFSMAPKQPIKLKTLMQFVRNESLYENSDMSLSAR
ncbi:hypothetical protein [Marinomonas flavescens]|uniref:hypothetical protein n=1 Tax=Marinomonas flavescens TaxID=2529379 RepID=UPI001056B2F4|nr:hypothetical protein [Marinomonas flavescens]